MNRVKKSAICTALFCSTFCPTTWAFEAEFDSSALHNLQIDTEQFRYGNPITAGEYYADVYINDEWRGQALLHFIQSSKDPMQGLCWSEELAQIVDLKPEFGAKISQNQTACTSAVDVNEQLKFRFDVGTHRLDVEMPQALAMVYPAGYVPRSQWQQGVPVAFLKYHLNGYHYDMAHQSYHHQYLGLESGINLGMWSIRQRGSWSWDNGKRSNYRHQEAYLQRDIDALDGRVRIGDFSTQSPLLDNIAIRGIAFDSDTRMLPYSQVGYAPRIQGVAKSNARIRIWQNGNIIDERTVPAGVFIIEDLYSLSTTSGDLTVEVLEADGSSHISIVPVAGSSTMLRPTQLRYHLAVGQYRIDGNKLIDKPLFHGSLQYGVNNYLTLQAGAILYQRYRTGILGAITGNNLGTLTADISQTQGKIGEKSHQTHRLHLGYRKYFNNSKTYFNADWYRYFSKHNISLDQVLRENDGYFTRSLLHSRKNQYHLSINQNLGKGGSVYLSGVLNQYWQGGHDYSYSFGYANSYKWLQYQISASRNYYLNQKLYENAVYVNLYLPLFNQLDRSHASISASYHHTDKHQSSRLAYYNNFGEQNQYAYTISTSKQSDNKATIAGSFNANLPMVKLDGSASRQHHDRQYSYGVSGAVIAHPRGITLNNELGDTFAIIHAKHASGTPIENGNGSKIDFFGNGIVSYLTPYQKNHIALDSAKLPDEVEISQTGKEFAPRANSATLIEFSTTSGALALFDIDFGGKDVPPAMSEAKDAQGNIVGHLTHDSRLLARLSDKRGNVQIEWAQSVCRFAYDVKDQGKDLAVYQVKCE